MMTHHNINPNKHYNGEDGAADDNDIININKRKQQYWNYKE